MQAFNVNSKTKDIGGDEGKLRSCEHVLEASHALVSWSSIECFKQHLRFHVQDSLLRIVALRKALPMRA